MLATGEYVGRAYCRNEASEIAQDDVAVDGAPVFRFADFLLKEKAEGGLEVAEFIGVERLEAYAQAKPHPFAEIGKR